MHELAKRARYPLSMRIFHWCLGAVIVLQFAGGWYMAGIPDDAADKYVLYPWHEASGILIFAFVVLRFGNRLRSELPPFPSALAEWEHYAARTVHYLLYVMMVVTPLAGYVMTVAYPEGDGFVLFGMAMPQVVPQDKAIFEAAHEAHEISAFALMALALLHALAALKHRFFDPPEADVLHRMT